jgi:hypothetical protein
MANFPDSISASKIHHRLSRRSVMRSCMATAAIATMPTLLATTAASQSPRDAVSLQAHKLAEALNAATGGAWEVNIRYGNGFVLISDRGHAEKVAHTVQS